eukprot:7391765-Prymnesium_polylepis.5
MAGAAEKSTCLCTHGGRVADRGETDSARVPYHIIALLSELRPPAALRRCFSCSVPFECHTPVGFQQVTANDAGDRLYDNFDYKCEKAEEWWQLAHVQPHQGEVLLAGG